MRDLRKVVAKLRRAADAELTARRAMSSGAKVSVDYFALIDLIDYFDETQDAATRVIKARDLLEDIMFRRTAR